MSARRDAGGDLLVYLRDNGPATVAEIANGTTLGATAIRNNLRVMHDSRYGQRWVYKHREDFPVLWALTEVGRRVANYRTGGVA